MRGTTCRLDACLLHMAGAQHATHVFLGPHIEDFDQRPTVMAHPGLEALVTEQQMQLTLGLNVHGNCADDREPTKQTRPMCISWHPLTVVLLMLSS